MKNGKGGAYLSGVLSDATGSIPFKIWNGREDVFVHYSAGKVIEAVVKVSEYKSELQCIVESEQFLTPTQIEGVKDELVQSSTLSEEELVEELKQLIDLANTTDNTWPNAAEVIEALEKARLWDLYKSVPAAVMYHQAYVRGLLEHSVQVARHALAVARVIPNMNIPLVIFGALFHDIGKCKSFTIDDIGLASSVSESGALLGHLVMGATYIPAVFRRILSEDKRILLAHICVSHHGRLEWGSAITPMFKEAQIIHEADYIDSKLGEFIAAETMNKPDVTTTKSWSLDRYLLTTGINMPPIIEEDEPEGE